MTTIDWTSQLSDQLTWHWDNQLRPRLEGLTDEEYFWEPVPGWSVRRRGTPSRAGINGGSGDFYIEFEFPEPTPTPVTSIACGWGTSSWGSSARVCRTTSTASRPTT